MFAHLNLVRQKIKFGTMSKKKKKRINKYIKHNKEYYKINQ